MTSEGPKDYAADPSNIVDLAYFISHTMFFVLKIRLLMKDEITTVEENEDHGND